MRIKILLGILAVVVIASLCYKSPLSATYNYNKAKELCKTKQYEASLPYFERSLFAVPNDPAVRHYYAMALANSKPTYTVQKHLYEIANSKNQDEASKYAKSKIISIRKNILKKYPNNYIANAIQGTDVLRWDMKSFPLKVYIEDSQDVPKYYTEAINQALKAWTSKTSFVKFKIVKDSLEANIVVSYKDIPSDACQSSACTFSAASTEPQLASGNVLRRMNLVLYKTTPQNKTFSRREILNTAMHEIGHTLGIMGHSDNSGDIMFPTKIRLDSSAASEYYSDLKISSSDVSTLMLLYNIEPGISNTKNLHSEKFIYLPFILGDDGERLQKKVEEYEAYIRNYPTIASGYINLAGVYSDMGEFDKAMSYLKQADAYAKSNNEKYVLEYNLAVVQFNLQNYKEALKHATNAQALDNNDELEEFIQEIEALNK